MNDDLREAVDAASRANVPLTVLVRVPGGDEVRIRYAELERCGDSVRIWTRKRTSVVPLAAVAMLERPDGRPWWPRGPRATGAKKASAKGATLPPSRDREAR